MSIPEITIIISSYKREKQVIRILENLIKYKPKNLKLEVLVCDSYSNYSLDDFLEQKFHNLSIKYLNIEKNVLAAKRNYGISKSSYNKIILLDDDCIPDENFLVFYLKELQSCGERTILSGVVEFPKEYINNYKHIKFRNSRHFKSNNIDKKFKMTLDKIVAMNMGFIKSEKSDKLGYFDERFVGYGFEDYEFAHKYINNGFELKPVMARIIHDEGLPDLSKYLKKHYHLGRDGMKNLLNISTNCAKQSIYYKIEKNILFKMIIKIPFIYYLLSLLEKTILKYDSLKIMYFPFIYNFVRLVSYSKGYLDRNKVKLSKVNKGWYE